ncbi:hypothetical protein EH223_01530 [candidate division KSB1 bacterium]|nr:hypothetical protein [candidate division KSB1 bacterium]RQW06880.1 MAG: hypothetical protein EH223_01530 [candidate division KSB1 bacterium]
MQNNSLDDLLYKIADARRKPDFSNLLAILQRRVPLRPTCFEFTINNTIYRHVTGKSVPQDGDGLGWSRYLVEAFAKLGYDFAVVGGWHLNALVFPLGEKHTVKSKSLNDGVMITDRASFEKYAWPDLDVSRLQPLALMANELPDGMKIICCGYEGILETTIDLVGFENLCLLLYMDPELTAEIFRQVGSRILSYYRHVVQFDSVGAIIANDDWGFKTQTMLAPDDLRRLVFPWYQKIVDFVHASGKPVILHSCGNPEGIIEDIIEKMRFDGKHSYEDTIVPVEQAIERWSDRIAIIGGIDVDFLSTRSVDQIRERTQSIRDIAMRKGGIAIGSGNSIPDYIPIDSYCAMQETALGLD